MILNVQRDYYTHASTMGMLDVNGVLKAYTIERPHPDFEAEVHCIPEGTYDITLYPSPRFKREMPLLMNVPGHTGIEIHWGNWATNSEGCIIVGFPRHIEDQMVLNSVDTFNKLFPLIEEAIKNEGCQIVIKDGPH